MKFLDTMLSRLTSEQELAGAEAVPELEMLQDMVNNLKRIEESVSDDQVGSCVPLVRTGRRLQSPCRLMNYPWPYRMSVSLHLDFSGFIFVR